MFITIEGIEGSGKTTQIPHMVEFLNERGHACLVTREPGGTLIGTKIRAILLDPGNKEIDPLAELLLYTADRAQHLQRRILPALSAGETVLCDRFFDATLVYQGYARGLDIGLIRRLHQLMLNGIAPDLTFLLDLAPEIGLARAWHQIKDGSRSLGETRFEKETLRFHERVRAGYLDLAGLEPERFRVVDAGQSEHEVRTEMLRILSLEID